MARTEFPLSVRKAAWARCAGRCEGCGGEFSAANPPEYDHVIEDALGGEPTLENCAVLGKRCCHDPKSRERAAPVAKAARIERKRAGITPKKAILPGSRASGWKRRIDGTVVRRPPP